MYHVIRCDLGVRINPKYPIAVHKVYYIVDKFEIKTIVEEYFNNIPRLGSKSGFQYVTEILSRNKQAYTLKEAAIKINKLNKLLCQQ